MKDARYRDLLVAGAWTRSRCPDCRARIFVPYDWERFDGEIDGEYGAVGRRIVEGHANAVHPDRQPWWVRNPWRPGMAEPRPND